MSDSASNQACSDQSQRCLAMFRDAVTAFTPEEWRRGDMPYLRPAGLALHVVETIEFYTSGHNADQFRWGHRFGVDWEGGEPDRFPDQEALLAYLDETEAKLSAWVDGTDLLALERNYRWTGPSKLALAMYMMRHTQHHVSEMAIELTRRRLCPPEWR